MPDKSVRMNIATVNKAKVRKEKRNGRDVIVVSSATLPFGVVMNGIRYPKEEILNSYKGLENTPAPLGHPKVGGQHVPALHPDGLAISYIGAHNTNVRVDGDRILLDKVIDVKRAEESENGRRVLEAVNEGKPIHTSTGLNCHLRNCDDGEAKQEAFNMEWDHDAILLDEPGAATPEQGVGMMVNSGAIDKSGNPVDVYNMSVEVIDMEIDHIGQSLVRAMDAREQASRWDRIKEAVGAIIRGDDGETVTNAKKEDTMSVSQEDFNKLQATVNELATGLPDMLANAVKPIDDKIDGLAKVVNAEADAKRADLIKKVVENAQLTQEAAEKTPTEALEALANAGKPGDAATIGNGAKPGAAPKEDGLAHLFGTNEKETS